MLVKYDLEGNKIDKAEIAIKRIRAFEDIALDYHENGYYTAESGGKDSMVIAYLCYLAGVKFELVHNHTTADHPETVYHVRKLKKWWADKGISYTISYPYHKGERTSMWKLIPQKGLPTRFRRWCCEVLKEGGGENRAVVTGVRWSESTRRKNNRGMYETFTNNQKDKIVLNNDNDFKRKSIEHCQSQGKIIVNPIIDWEDDDVWEFISKHDLPYNPLYDKGYSRVGCVGCPLVRNDAELERNPRYKKMYMRAGEKYLKNRALKGKENDGNWSTPELYYLRWTEQIKDEAKGLDGQTKLDI